MANFTFVLLFKKIYYFMYVREFNRNRMEMKAHGTAAAATAGVIVLLLLPLIFHREMIFMERFAGWRGLIAAGAYLFFYFLIFFRFDYSVISKSLLESMKKSNPAKFYFPMKLTMLLAGGCLVWLVIVLVIS